MASDRSGIDRPQIAGGSGHAYFFSEIRSIPPLLQSSYYPSLDGLRGLAIIMVVMSHLSLTSGYAYNYIFNSKTGVLMFFVLSGFLITTLCIKEKVATGTISLKNFYVRRALRIFPVSYLYIASLIVLNYAFKLGINYISILGAALYVMNISSIFRRYWFSWHTTHFWSLSVEEQFYLIVPFILQRNHAVYTWFLLSIVFALPLLLFMQSVYPPLNNIVLYSFSHYLIKFHAIAVGCLYSLILFKYPFNSVIRRDVKLLTNLAAIALIVFLQYDDFFTLRNMLSGVAVSALTGFLIVTNLVSSPDIVYRVLNLKILKMIGVLSYSIYIWQQLFTSNDTKLPAFMINYPTNIICIVVVSWSSWYFYERFFLKLKSRFSTVPHRQQLDAMKL